MKRLLSTAILCMLVSITFAQKNAIKEARKMMDSDKFTEARQLIEQASTDPETETDQETWKTVGDIEYKVYSNEKDKELKGKVTGEKHNEDLMYSSLYKTYAPYLKADNLGELPDDKGKIKNKVRKDIVNKLKTSHIDYYNGGAYYSEQKKYSLAADFFERYCWEIPSLTMFSESQDTFNTNDSTYQIIKYYAAISAIQAKEHDKALRILTKIKSEPFIANSACQESDIYELLTSEYKEIGDTVTYMKALEDGADKFPQNTYFIPNLINEYIASKDPEKAIAYLDQAIINTPANSCELYSVKANLFSEKGDFDKSLANYEKALAIDANCERALDGLGLLYILKAQELRDVQKASRKEQSEIDEKANELYRKAYPLLEKYKSLLEARKAKETVDSKKDEINKLVKSVLYKLRNVYYNLDMDKEYEAAEAAYNAMA